MAWIPFNRPRLAGNEFPYLQEAINNGHLSAGGPFTRRCEDWLLQTTGMRAFLTHSCTAALEMCALLLDLEPGDEIVMPSYTFVSTANAFALRGAVPVFVDIRPDTLTIDENRVEDAITPRTRAIVAVHYAGVMCDMDRIHAIAAPKGLTIIEDAAQALMSSYKGRPAGSFGELAALSFHETKNVTAGEGGALLVSDARLADRSEPLRDKGTDRACFLRGEVEKYTWVGFGSSYGLSELNAAFLFAQLEAAAELTADRIRTWSLYHEALESFEERGFLRRPIIPDYAAHNAHMYYVLVSDIEERTALLETLNANGINAVFHFVPLHESQGARLYARVHGDLSETTLASEKIVRLPLWSGMTEEQVGRIAAAIGEFARRRVHA